MTVQIQPAKPKDQHNGLADIEARLLAEPSLEVTAVVTYAVAKVVDDKKKDEVYPVVYAKHIEPILDESARSEAADIQLTAYRTRTGEEELDFSDIEGGTGDGSAPFAKGGDE